MSTVRVSLKTSPQRVAWPTLHQTWALAGTLPTIDGLWMNDHLTDMGDTAGPSLEALERAVARPLRDDLG